MATLMEKDVLIEVEAAVEKVLANGLRTADIFEEGCTKVRCSEMGDALVAALKA